MLQQPEQASSRPVETRPYTAQASGPRMRFSAITTLLGVFVFAAGAKPDWFGWGRSPVVGFIQIAVFLIGLAMIRAGGFVGILALWGREQRSILADIGSRLVGTGS